MIETLSPDDRQSLIDYRLERSKESLEEADYMINSEHYLAAVNRLYYACYYATIALFLKKNINAQTHSGVKQMLGMHFIKTGILPMEQGKAFATLFEKRQSGDYDDFFFCDKKLALELKQQALSYINAVKALINQQ